MLKCIKIKHLMLSTMTAFALMGCGEILETVEDRPTPPADEINYENQGRYIDENVSGIYYSDCSLTDTTCNPKINGTTTDDGTFGFILGKPIYFSVAGLQLDTVAPKYLVGNGVVITVPENNVRLASFLQSMDNDGVASNGIKIVPEVVQALVDLNVSQYESVANPHLDIATLVEQVQAKLDESTPVVTPSDINTTTDDVNTTTPHSTKSQQHYQKSSVATLRYVDETEALTHLQATISKYKPVPSITVKDVIEKIRDIADNANSYTEEEIQEKIKAIRTQLDNPLEGDRNVRDIEIAKALVDLSELTNQSYLEDVFTFQGDGTTQLSQIIKEMALNDNNNTIVASKEENSTNIIEVSKKATLGVARNIKSISDRLGNALATVPQHYHFTYEGFDIGIDNIAALRATLLATASKMSWATAYSVGVDDNYKPQTYTDANGSKYQFTDSSIYQDAMLNSPDFGKAIDQTSLDLAKSYLTESALILKDLDAYLMREDLNESTTNTTENTDSNQEVIDYGAKLYQVLSDGNGTVTVTDKNNSEGKKEEMEIAVNRLFKLDTAPKVSDLGTEWAYESCPQDFNISTEDEIKKYDKRFCYPNNLSYEWDKWNYSHYCELEVYPKIKVQSETSSVDELITQIKVGDEVKTGEELINYLFDNNNSGVRDYCGIGYYDNYQPYNPEFTYEKVAGQTYYNVAEVGDEATIQVFSILGTNIVKSSPINETPANEASFSIENGTLFVSYGDFQIEERLLEENGDYNRVQSTAYYGGALMKDIISRAYYDKSQAEAFLGELRNFKYIGSDTSILTSPNGGESWTNGESRSIDWNATKISTSYVNLYVLHDDPSDLYLYDADVTTMLTNKTWHKLPSDSIGIYNEGSHYLDPADLSGTGDAYVILITDENNSSWDISDGTFSLNH